MRDRIVIKVGSLAVTNESGGVDQGKIHNIISDLHQLLKHGHTPILISSGAINTGRIFIQRPEEKKMMISYQQASAAVGQPLLMQAYIQALRDYSWPCAQILVTHEDFKDRRRFLNIRNTINRLLDNGILPIINENDSVSFEEISVGDNDQLAVMITEASDANKLILLTEADGLYDKNPSDKDAQRISLVDYQDDFSSVKIATKTSVGRGGMQTKLMAIRKLTPIGVDVVLGTFNAPGPVSRLLKMGEGTTFRGHPEKQKSRRKSWLSTVVKNDCYVVVDDGAARALIESQTSLLPVGIKKIHGKFKRGDVISIRHRLKIIGVGISEYGDRDLERIKGKKSQEIPQLLELIPSKVAIHKDNLLIKDSKK
jgi:glutamate 5-kinase